MRLPPAEPTPWLPRSNAHVGATPGVGSAFRQRGPGGLGRRLLLGVVLALASVPSVAVAAEDPLRPDQWNLDVVHADQAHRISIGTGATVAVIDSGVDATHPDLIGNVINGPDFVDGGRVTSDPNGHGTNVAGTIVDHAANGLGTEGAAPGAKVLAIRVLDAHEQGNTILEAQGIDAAVAAGVQVINLSLGNGPNVLTQALPDSGLVAAMNRAVNAGIVIVAAAGNDSLPLCEQPLLAPRILCVGAINRSLHRASYSDFASRVDLVAPGGELTPGDGIEAAAPGGTYAAYAGTSQATPHVAATAALLISLGLRGQQVIDRILATTTDLHNPTVYGHGLLDMNAAVDGLGPPLPQASSQPPTPLPPRPRHRHRRHRHRSRPSRHHRPTAARPHRPRTGLLGGVG